MPSAAAPAAEPWHHWERHHPGSTRTIDHDAWDLLLTRYLCASPDGVHRFRYRSVTAADRERLERYLNRLSGVAISAYNRPEQKAFWINLYNALTVQVVLDHYPVASIREIDISPGWFSVGPWRKKLIQVDDIDLSLDDIEHRILRPVWRDPRIHYAVNCAAIGCPNLQRRAFRGAGLAERLEEAARDYVNHPRAIAWSTDGWTLSKIYQWFRDDFGGDESGVLDHIKRYADPALAATLNRSARVQRYRYDWSLNDAAPAP